MLLNNYVALQLRCNTSYSVRMTSSQSLALPFLPKAFSKRRLRTVDTAALLRRVRVAMRTGSKPAFSKRQT